MNIIIKKNSNVTNNQPKIYDLGQIVTTLQDLLDDSTILIESDQTVILKITNTDDSISYYLLTIPKYINGEGVYGVGKDITEDNLILINNFSSGGGGGLEQREIVYLTEDTTLPSNANSEYYINEFNAKITIQSGLYALGTSIIIYGLENDEIYSTFSDTQSGILINGNNVDETSPFLLQTSGNIILTKTVTDDFAESWLATYEPNVFPTVSNLATLQSVTNQGRFTNQKIVSSTEISVKDTENSTFGVRILPSGIFMQPGGGLAHSIGVVRATAPYNQYVYFSDGEFTARIGIQPGSSGNTFFKLPSRTGGDRVLLDDLSLPQVANSYANDTEAASGGVQVGQLYHTAGVVKIRLV